MAFHPGRGTAANQYLTWDGTKLVWSPLAPTVTKSDGEGKRVIDRSLNRPIYQDVFYSVAQAPNIVTDIPTDFAYYFATSQVVGDVSFNRIAVMNSTLSTGAISMLSSTIMGNPYKTGNFATTGWKYLTAGNQDHGSGNSFTAKTFFFATGGPTNNQLIRFTEATSGITVLDTLTIGTAVSKPFFDGSNVWMLANGGAGTGQLRRLSVAFTAGALALDGTIYASNMTYDTDRTHFAMDGATTFVLDANATTSLIYTRAVFGGVTTTLTLPVGGVQCIAYDGRFLWGGLSNGTLIQLDPYTGLVTNTVAAQTTQGITISNIEEMAFDGEWLYAICGDGTSNRNVIIRFDPYSGLITASYVGDGVGVSEQFYKLTPVQGDRNGANIYAIRNTSTTREIRMFRELVDMSVGSLRIENGLYRASKTVDATNYPTPVTLSIDKSIVMVQTNTYASGVTFVLPSNASGVVITFKDMDGVAATKNITITVSGGNTIDGAASYVINTNYGSVTLWSGSSTSWYSLR